MSGRNMGIKNLAENDFPLHFSASVSLPSLRQRHADDSFGRNMIGRNMGVIAAVQNKTA
jgi:hypothetical protein